MYNCKKNCTYKNKYNRAQLYQQSIVTDKQDVHTPVIDFKSTKKYKRNQFHMKYKGSITSRQGYYKKNKSHQFQERILRLCGKWKKCNKGDKCWYAFHHPNDMILYDINKKKDDYDNTMADQEVANIVSTSTDLSTTVTALSTIKELTVV
jgi:hypothetical protein